jgi:hypothetical protein
MRTPRARHAHMLANIVPRIPITHGATRAQIQSYDVALWVSAIGGIGGIVAFVLRLLFPGIKVRPSRESLVTIAPPNGARCSCRTSNAGLRWHR